MFELTCTGAKRQACADMKAVDCPEHFKDVSCDTVSLQELRTVLTRADWKINSEAVPLQSCTVALRKGLIAFDLAAIGMPLEHYQADRSAGPLPALTSLFSALNISLSTGQEEVTRQESAEGSESSTVSGGSSTRFIQM